MGSNYGDRYPGSGGATRYPLSGGSDWHPLPDDSFETVPKYKTITKEHRPGVIGRLFGRETTYSQKKVRDGTEVIKHYR